MYWEIEEKNIMFPLSLATFLEDDVYSPTSKEEDEKLLEDIKTNGQITNAFFTEDNVCIGSRRICRLLKAIGHTHVRAQRVKVESKYRQLFLFSTNNTRLKTKLECCREVEIVLNTIPRHQGKSLKDISTPAPTEGEKPVEYTPKSFADKIVAGENMNSPEDLQYYENNKEAIEAEMKSKEVPNPQPVNNIDENMPLIVTTPTPAPTPIKTTIPLPTPEPTEEKPKTPIQQAIDVADNGTKSSEFQKYQYIKRIDEKYGSNLLEMLASKCPNVDKIYKAAQKVEQRNKKKDKPTPPLVVPTTSRLYKLFNKSNWQMDEVKDSSIDFVLTSNAYYKQIDYNENNKNQMGQEASIGEFIENLMKSYNEVKKKMAPTGNLFVNFKGTIDKNGNLVGEQEFIIAMRKSGWIYRDTFIWLKKGGGKRSGNKTRRPENSYEPIFWFTKTSDYYYKPIEIPTAKDITVTFKAAETRIESNGLSCYDKIDVSLPFTSFKNVIDETTFLDVVVTNSAATDSQFMNELYGKHPAPFPMALPLLFLLQFCPPSGRVLEPFLGRGAGLVSPLMLGHTCYGYETEAEYFEQSQKLLADVVKDIDYYRERMKEIELAYQQKYAA